MSSIKIRTKMENNDMVRIRTLIKHPMETGTRKSKKTGKPIPAHFIQNVVCEHKGNIVFTGYLGPAISKNPYLSFRFSGAAPGDVVKLSWVDNKGEKDSGEVTIK